MREEGGISEGYILLSHIVLDNFKAARASYHPFFMFRSPKQARRQGESGTKYTGHVLEGTPTANMYLGD